MKKINSSIASIVNVEGQSYFRLVIDNGALSYSKMVLNDADINRAIENAINILISVPDYENYAIELETLLSV